MTRKQIICALFVLGWSLPSQLSAQANDEGTYAALQREAEWIKPTTAELQWQQIPWVIDLAGALEEARKEKRPIFFWAAGGRDRDGTPLERC